MQRQFHSKTDSTIKPQIGFNVYSFQKQIQQLNPQMGFNIKSIQNRIQPLDPQIGF